MLEKNHSTRELYGNDRASGDHSDDANALPPIGEKIFLDRYALKDVAKQGLKAGDLVIVCVDLKTGQREIGTIQAIEGDKVRVELRDGAQVERAFEHVDKPIETRSEEMQYRVARGIAAVEAEGQREVWEERFRWLLNGWKFVPAGRILAAAGSDQHLTFYNCYVIPSPHDSRHGIVKTLSQMMEIMSRGGGVGINVSSLRPRHSYVKGVNGRSSGAVSWGALYSFVTGLIEQGGSRRGALMLILDVWHPDVIEFIHSKREMGKITNANISVAITDDFMEAVKNDETWDLVFPDTLHVDYDTTWDGDLDKWRDVGKPVIVHKTVQAREIWDTIIESAWASAEPGVFFVDRYNRMSNSWYFAPIRCTNPCGEQGLPAWGACNLGSINLSKFVRGGDVAWDELGQTVRYAVRFLDNVIDATPYFFEENEQQQLSERRVGLGTMGLAEMLIRLGLRYGSAGSVDFIDRLYGFIATQAYLASCDYAAEKGAFPLFNSEKFLRSGFIQRMPQEVREAVSRQGIRNVTLLTQAPTGTIGTMVGTSTGIEPFYSWSYYRKSRLGMHEERVSVVEEWQREHPSEPLPDCFVTAMDLTPEEHVRVQAAVQRWVDSSISKTCNVPGSYTVEQTRELYEYMYRLGCKGGTVYRDSSRDEQVLLLKEDTAQQTTDELNGHLIKKPRPRKLRGYTYKQATPVGTAYVNVTEDEDGHPFEVFLNVGKGGSDTSAAAEAIGRLISLVLRLPSPRSPEERLGEVVAELSDIGGGRTLGFGPHRVSSLPDGVAQALAEHLGQPPVSAPPLSTDPGGNGAATFTDDYCPECGQATLVREEGCRKCYTCGFSEC